MKKIVPWDDLTRSTGGKGWISFGQIYLGFGKIYVNACSGGDAGRSDNNYGLQPEKTSIKIFKVNSDGSRVRVYNNSQSPFDTCDTNSVPADERKEVEFGKAEGIEAGSHTYRIEMSGIDSHDGSHSATIEGIPAPPPPPGPILTLRNKTGHFHSSGPVELEFAAYTNGGTELAPKELQLTIDSATQTVTDFPHIETVSGDGLHEVVAIGLDEDDNESSITYRFSIGTNDWSPELLTPVKSLRYTGTENSIVNVYTENANLTTSKFTDLFGAGNVCYANANTAEVTTGSAETPFNLDVAFLTDQDTQDQHAEVSYLNTDTDTMLPFDLVVNQPLATDLNYLTEQRQKDHEMLLFICSYDPVVVEDECVIPSVVKEYCLISSSPNANNEYEFAMSGLIGRVQAKQITTHPITQQYYHVHYLPSDRHDYGKLEDNVIVDIAIKPENTDLEVRIDLFNACGSKHEEIFLVRHVGSGSVTGSIGAGGSPTGSSVTITPVIRTASTPNYHSLLEPPP